MEERLASCTRCDRLAPSSPELGFFRPTGEGSDPAVNHCKCGYHRIAHDGHSYYNRISRLKCAEFVPYGPRERDWYWCGCGNTD